jgi:hypothetical protein
MDRLTGGDVACWVIKSALPPAALDRTWAPGTTRELNRCLRASYRLELMTPGQPCLLWLSGRDRPGVHAHGALTGVPESAEGGPEIAVRLTLLEAPIPRSDLLADPDARDAEVLRMPAGSNPSWLSGRQYAAVLARLGRRDRDARLGAWTP